MQLKRIYYFSISLILGCSYDIHNHLCSTYRGLWFELSGRTLTAQALGLNLVNCKLLHFPLFCLVTTKALAIKPHWFTTSCRASPKKSVVASFHPDIMQKLLEADIMLHHGMGLAEPRWNPLWSRWAVQLKRICYFSISLNLGCSYDIHNHLCSTYRGLWFELSGRTLTAQALGLNLVNCKLLHFPLFCLVTTKALAIKPHWFTTSCRASPKKSVVASFHPDIMQKLLEADIMLHHGMGLAEQHTLWFYTLLWQANHATAGFVPVSCYMNACFNCALWQEHIRMGG